MWWFLISLLSGTVLVVFDCADDRKNQTASSGKKKPSGKDTKASGTTSGKSSRTQKEAEDKSRSKKSHSKSGKSGKSSKSRKSSKSAKSSKSGKSRSEKPVKVSSKSTESSVPQAPKTVHKYAVPNPIPHLPPQNPDTYAQPTELTFVSIGGLENFKFVRQ